MSQKDNNLATASRWLPTPLLALGLLLLPALAIALGGSGGDVEVPVSTFSSGGGSHSALLPSGDPFDVDFSVGLTMGTDGTGAGDYSLSSGFQLQREAIEQVATTPVGPIFRRGDANGDSLFNIADAIAMLNFLFLSGGLPCDDAGDSNDDGQLDISDSIFLLGALFGDSSLPSPPGIDQCGPDPTDDDLDCDSYNSC